ncbi:MAG: hypothetical protein LUC83_02235 [Clostridiales bacterium]|nr:hypothetical protein [Clostridiales bacterium]
MKKKWIATTLVMGGCIAAVMGLSGCGTTKVSLSDYVEIAFDGYDGYGTVDVDFDEDAFEEKYGKKLKLNENAEEWGYETVAEVFWDCYDVSASPQSGLSNGDEVTVEWYEIWYGADNFIEGDVEVSLDSATFEVTGLEEVAEADIFDEVTVIFSGIAPAATAEVQVSGDLSAAWFTLDQSSDLDIGDVVTVTVSESAVESIIAATGTVPSEMSKEYEVEGVAHYAASLDEIPDDIMDSMKAQAEDAYEAYAASDFSESEELLSYDYIGSYLLTLKDGMSASDSNMLYLVYKATVKNEDTDSFAFYRYCMFSDIIALEDGTYSVDLSDYEETYGDVFWGIESGDVVSTDNFWYAGFSDLTTLFNRCVTTNVEYYTYESTVED